MGSPAKAIRDAIVAAIRTVDGTGSYTHDLSGPGVVGTHRIAIPPQVPHVWVSMDGVVGEHDINLGFYRRNWAWDVVGYCHPTEDSAEARQDAALDLMNDLMLALESDRTLAGTVLDLIIHGTAFSGDEEDLGSRLPMAVLRVECYNRHRTGA